MRDKLSHMLNNKKVPQTLGLGIFFYYQLARQHYDNGDFSPFTWSQVKSELYTLIMMKLKDINDEAFMQN